MAYVTFYVEDVPFNVVWAEFKRLSINKRLDLLNKYAYECEHIYSGVIWQAHSKDYFCLDRAFFRHENDPYKHKSMITRVFKKKIKNDLCHRLFYKMILKTLAK